MHKDPKIEPDAYSKEEEKYLNYLIKKHGKRIKEYAEKNLRALFII